MKKMAKFLQKKAKRMVDALDYRKERTLELHGTKFKIGFGPYYGPYKRDKRVCVYFTNDFFGAPIPDVNPIDYMEEYDLFFTHYDEIKLTIDQLRSIEKNVLTDLYEKHK